MRKRGLSGTITTVLIILIAMAAVGLMWAFLGPLLREGGRGINTDIFTVKMVIVKGTVDWNDIEETVTLKVRRDPGKANVTGFRVVLVDDAGRTFAKLDPEDMDEFEVKDVNVNYKGVNLGNIVAIEVYPILIDRDGNEFEGNLADRYVFRGDEGGGNGDREEYRVFVTADDYKGNLGGLFGADKICQDLASELGGKWMAWLSDSNIVAKDRLHHSSLPYKLLNGKTIANNWDDLIGSEDLTVPINVDKDGNTISSPFNVFTNTKDDGDRFSRKDSKTCKGWTNNGGGRTGRVGEAGKIDSEWTNSLDIACNVNNRIYCFEQPNS